MQLNMATYNNINDHLICYVWLFYVNSIVSELLFKKVIVEVHRFNIYSISNIYIVENNLNWTYLVDVWNNDGGLISRFCGRFQAPIINEASDSIHQFHHLLRTSFIKLYHFPLFIIL